MTSNTELASSRAGSLEVFSYEHSEIRAVVLDGRRWAVAPDICAYLEIQNAAQAVAKLDPDDRLLITRLDDAGGIWQRIAPQPQSINLVSEDGATDLVLNSRKPGAQRFRRWLTHEVWPALRDSGWFSTLEAASPLPIDPAGSSLVLGPELHLYVLEIVGLGVKVGISKEPARRVETIKREAAGYGYPHGRVSVSAPHVEARANELRLITLGGDGNRREYLRADFDTAMAMVEKLPMSRADRIDVMKRQASAFNLLRNLVTRQVAK